MATNLGTLTLNLLANTGSYIQGLSRAERETSQSTGKMKNAFSNFKSTMNESLNTSQLGLMVNDLTARLGALSGGLLNVTAAAAGMAAGGSIIAAAGLTTLAIQTAKADAEMAVLANRAQIGTTNFQILTYASEQLGISQDQLGGIFADVQEKLGEFSATGSGGASDFFDVLRNNTKLTDDQIKQFGKTLQGKDGVEAVQLLKNKLDELNASSQEQRFVFESLGSDLGNLLPLFEDGGVLFEQYGQALEDAGVIKSKEAILQSQILAAQTQAVNLQFQGAKSELVQGFMPALVNVADAMFGTSKNGNQLQDVGEGLGEVFKFLATTGIGLSAVIQTVGDGFGALAAMAVAAASGDIKGAVAIYKDSEDQFAKIIENSSERIEKLREKNIDGKNSASELTNAIFALNQAQASASSGLKVNTKEADDNAKAKDKLANASARAARETSRLAEQQKRLRESIQYQFSTREVQLQLDYERQIADIRKASFHMEDESKFLNIAIARLEAEKDLRLAQLAFEVTEHKLTEEEKLNISTAIAIKEGKLRTDLNDNERKSFIRSITEKHTQSLAWLRLEQAQRISDAGEMLRTDLQNMEIKYALERKKIEENAQLSDDERQKRMALSFATEEHQKRQNLNSTTAAWGGTYADLMGTGAQYQMEQDRFNKYDESQALFDAQMALAQSAEEREAIWQAHTERMAMIDQDYWGKTKSYQLGMASDVFGGLAGVMLNFVDESSSSYRALVAIQKGANLASVLMNSITAISAAWASAPFPYNLPAVGIATIQTGALQATLQAFTPQGFATGGHITGKGTGTSDDIPIWASNGEFMIRAAAVDKLGLANLDYINRTGMLPPRFATGGMIGKEKYIAQSSRSDQSGAVNVIINVPAGYTANESRDSNGNVTIDVVKQVVKQAFGNLNQSNSFESKQIKNNFNVGRAR
ncbi:hypothetical protein AYL20_07465 [Acinetobacter venetianus]|uniref:hypothetical protein n=1 Tax=Acinetobacter venetianus TaxID=52133 RepID=UPI00077567A2|nr:hypothetical protein [Acinetobacter venetianus]KXO78205.1 hypothetical protein AYL20_07465 [Acinetobacter venetianus]